MGISEMETENYWRKPTIPKAGPLRVSIKLMSLLDQSGKEERRHKWPIWGISTDPIDIEDNDGVLWKILWQ